MLAEEHAALKILIFILILKMKGLSKIVFLIAEKKKNHSPGIDPHPQATGCKLILALVGVFSTWSSISILCYSLVCYFNTALAVSSSKNIPFGNYFWQKQLRLLRKMITVFDILIHLYEQNRNLECFLSRSNHCSSQPTLHCSSSWVQTDSTFSCRNKITALLWLCELFPDQ